ncbi:SGNH/GDSL hydrolase family protein [Nocardioides sp. LS1]|uniref:SGNH/GDSL hydrolase family protein n=1 Tax=Nocardioides sp. LS1 TaxID=1027620 RepID=UPI000FF926DF|nr:SGNH/GDSL hydrolase family protein [Nocardioides sp. LS1]GCD92274.1 lipase [Nocardioides sp. LS1]
MLRRALSALVLLAVCALYAAPAGGAQAAEPDPIDYVALGDSYSAGPLIRLTRQDPVGCFRSTNNYPAYLAGFLGVATYRDMTCSGARTDDFFTRQGVLLGDAPAPQLSALSADTDLVTIGIGGNDHGLFGSMISTCQQVRHLDPTGSPCRKHFTTRDGVDTKLRDARDIERLVAHALIAVHRAAPNAAVYVVGYPRLLPLTGTCDEVPFATGDYAWGRRIEWLLNKSLQQAAADHRATYVNLYPATRGHDACGTDAWINGSVAKLNVALDFHPFQVGEREMGRAVFRSITGQVTPDVAGDAAPPAGSVVLNPVTP